MINPTIRELQCSLSDNDKFQTRTDLHHALLKAASQLTNLVDAFDHDVDPRELGIMTAEAARKYLADLVICALCTANTWPGGWIDLQDAIDRRLAAKSGTDAR